MDKWVKRTVIVVISLNILQLFIYPEFWSWTSSIGWPSSFNALSLQDLEEPQLKSWPVIPSYRPWTLVPDLQPFTCEAYFGNGYTDIVTLRKAPKRNRKLNTTDDPANLAGSFQCRYSQTLRTSICEGTRMVMNVDKIQMSKGGEYLEKVIGRNEDEELPSFQDGAFEVKVPSGSKVIGKPMLDSAAVDNLMPAGQVHQHTLRQMLGTLQAVDGSTVECARTVVEPTLFVTRFEYANLFHTSTDWFSAYSTSRIVDLANRPHLVFLDGHCKSPMDDGWEAMFTTVTYAKHFTGPVCFDHAIFAPLGYDVPLFKHITSTLDCLGKSANELDAQADKRKTARVQEFGEFVAKSFETGLEGANTTEAEVDIAKAPEVRVLMVRREDYLAHPRHSGKPESRLSNELEVLSALQSWAKERSSTYFEDNKVLLNVTVMNGLLAHMTLQQQMKAVRGADVLVGAHGAGLTHLLFAKSTASVLEISSPTYRRPHFQTLSYWQGRDYHIINMEGSVADTNQVTRVMDQILNDISKQKSF